ncbi:VOC family protein [Dermacoccus abyssi]|uniref:VOC family protein n=1 Tax=Dermacoccus abyssi TaxID=322596 RepID=UPI0021A8DA61|nr:VOC family protein [Dermacoccus abyssi]MCT1985836.1 VOC family protein [Dermacoccus abyssi]
MTTRTANFCIDCSDPRALALWWAEVVDDFEAREQYEWTDEEAWLSGPLGRDLIFLRVPEPKQVKNRMHVCVRPVGSTRDEEVERLLAHGATMVDDLRQPDEGWAVLADPEGNEFCVLTADAERCGVLRS